MRRRGAISRVLLSFQAQTEFLSLNCVSIVTNEREKAV